MTMTQNQIIIKWMNTPNDVTRKQYLDSKLHLTSLDVAKKFYDTPGYNNELYYLAKTWFNSVIPGHELNIYGFMRIIAM
ncbi:hypothetical protein CHI12_11625 [Terribacillus saccharophilus]|uniref:Uncharacterized protein n=1 Tax=Terribacillus saccharophilus TaxID=361277 RepID=A0A268HC12_9BACI|nr:hypothetical protein [Terribacillus saccharophilus]PAE07370.1 hypothetical protein CHI12_11625 [Terribacillus saccharophilus]